MYPFTFQEFTAGRKEYTGVVIENHLAIVNYGGDYEEFPLIIIDSGTILHSFKYKRQALAVANQIISAIENNLVEKYNLSKYLDICRYRPEHLNDDDWTFADVGINGYFKTFVNDNLWQKTNDKQAVNLTEVEHVNYFKENNNASSVAAMQHQEIYAISAIISSCRVIDDSEKFVHHHKEFSQKIEKAFQV